ncbi:MAG: helix-turn-helix domain-containing protein, partial [Rhodospirillales bacterium]
LKRKVQGISAKVLTERLRLLESADVIERHYQPTIPPQVTYSLTQRGRELGPMLDALDGTAQRWSVEDAQRAAQSTNKSKPAKAA